MPELSEVLGVPEPIEEGLVVMEEEEKWQHMMVSCRRACKFLGEEFREPDYLNWPLGSHYHDDLWARVRGRKLDLKAKGLLRGRGC